MLLNPEKYSSLAFVSADAYDVFSALEDTLLDKYLRKMDSDALIALLRTERDRAVEICTDIQSADAAKVACEIVLLDHA